MPIDLWSAWIANPNFQILMTSLIEPETNPTFPEVIKRLLPNSPNELNKGPLCDLRFTLSLISIFCIYTQMRIISFWKPLWWGCLRNQSDFGSYWLKIVHKIHLFLLDNYRKKQRPQNESAVGWCIWFLHFSLWWREVDSFQFPSI